MSVRARLTVSVAAAALLLAGCGSTNMSAVLSHAGNASSVAAPDLGSGSGHSGPSDPGSGNPGSGDSGSGSAGSADSGSGAGLGILSPDCMGVVSAYTSIAMALVPSLGGAGTYDSSQVTDAISGLGGKVPDELQPDFQVLSGAAKQASGKSSEQAGAILGSDAVSKASDDISNWMDKNCGT